MAGPARRARIGERARDRPASRIARTVCRVLAGREVDLDAVPSYLDPTVKRLMPDPNTLTGMQAAAARLADAVQRGEQIAILGDYDVDGATSTALLVRVLRAGGSDPFFHIPDRLFEGYGPNPEAMRELATRGAKLIVTVDCGTRAAAPSIEAAKLRLRRRRARPSSGRRSAAAGGRGRQSQPRGRSLRAGASVRRRRRLPGAGADVANCASASGMPRDPSRICCRLLDLVALAPSATWSPLNGRQPRLRREGAARACAAARTPAWRALGAWRASASRPAPSISASCSGRASTPAAASATQTLGAGCSLDRRSGRGGADRRDARPAQPASVRRSKQAMLAEAEAEALA